MKEIIPLNDYVVLEEVEKPETALVLESADLEPTNRGRVVKGPQGYLLGQSLLHEGDEVLFLPHLFQSYEITGRKLLLGKRDAVIAILK